MKSRTKPALRAVSAATVRLELPIHGVLRDVNSAFPDQCVQAGKAVLAAMLEDDRTALCGPKGVPDAGRRAVRGGTRLGAVMLGGQRIAVRRLWARDLEDGELSLPTCEWAAGGDPLDAATMAAIAAGVSMRRYRQTLQPLPETEQARSTSRSAMSRRYVAFSAQQLAQWLSRSLSELDLPVVMIDGIHWRGRVILVALGIDAKGNEHLPGLREGLTEATRGVRSVLSRLVERGLDADRARRWVIDGGKALRRAVVECFGAMAVVQRRQRHKQRNLLDHLPADMHASVSRALRDAWNGANAGSARRQLQRLAASLRARHPGAAASLREGLDWTRRRPCGPPARCTHAAHDQPHRAPQRLDRTLHTQRQAVKRWRDGQMTLRWITSALSEAKDRFRKLRGHRDMKHLIAALDKRIATTQPAELKAA
jgi:hypothetical protein